MPSSELLSRFLYDDINEENTSYTPLHKFGLEFQHDPSSMQQTFYNYASWYKYNDDNIGRLPEPFFSDFITLITARSFGENLNFVYNKEEDETIRE